MYLTNINRAKKKIGKKAKNEHTHTYTGSELQYSSIMYLPVRCMVAHFWVPASMMIKHRWMYIPRNSKCIRSCSPLLLSALHALVSRAVTEHLTRAALWELLNFGAACTNQWRREKITNQSIIHLYIYFYDKQFINSSNIRRFNGFWGQHRLIHFQMDAFHTENIHAHTACRMHACIHFIF